jgi:FKBP-type peptidyl-prolyl cis-trans isomerase
MRRESPGTPVGWPRPALVETWTIMRRFALLFAPLLLASAAVAGCGGSGGPSTGQAANPKVVVTGAFGTLPTVKIPDEPAGGDLQVKILIPGSGPALARTDALLGNYVAYIWSGTRHRLAQSTYDTVPALFGGRLLPGLTTALKGARIGERVLAVLPPRYAYGSQGNTSGGVGPNDTLVFVIDVIKAFAHNASVTGKTIYTGGSGLPAVTPGVPPTITIPKGAKPPSTLVTKTLIQGSGPRVGEGQYVVVQYVGVNWRTGKVFDSSVVDGDPYGFILGLPASEGGVITGWDNGLLGQMVGSRVMLVIPPKYGYGSEGNSTAGIKGTDTLVFVIDVLGAYSPHTT